MSVEFHIAPIIHVLQVKRQDRTQRYVGAIAADETRRDQTHPPRLAGGTASSTHAKACATKQCCRPWWPGAAERNHPMEY